MMTVRYIILFLAFFSNEAIGQEVTIKKWNRDQFTADFSKLVYFDFNAFEGRKNHISGNEYHWIQMTDFRRDSIRRNILSGYLITDNGTFNLTYKSTKVIKETNVEGGEGSFEIYYDMKFVSDKKIEFSKVAFLSFHKFEISKVSLYEANRKQDSDVNFDEFFGKGWIASFIGTKTSFVRFFKISDAITNIEYSMKSGQDFKITRTVKLVNKSCRKHIFEELRVYECPDEVQFITAENSILNDHQDNGGAGYKPLFSVLIDEQKHYFIINGVGGFVKRKDGNWGRSDKIQSWFDW